MFSTPGEVAREKSQENPSPPSQQFFVDTPDLQIPSSQDVSFSAARQWRFRGFSKQAAKTDCTANAWSIYNSSANAGVA